MLILDYHAAVFWDLWGSWRYRGVPSPTHSHQEQMALAGLGSVNEPLLSLDVA